MEKSHSRKRNVSQPPILDKPLPNEYAGDRSPLMNDN